MIKNTRKTGVILSYILIIVQAVVGLLYVPLLLKFLGENEYGLYQLMGSLIAYFSIMDFGLSASVVRFYSKYLALNDKKNMENVLGVSKRIYNVMTILMVIIAFVFFLNIANIFGDSLSVYEIGESKRIFVLLIINIGITLSTNIYTSVITAHERFVFLKLLSILQVVIQPILVVALITAQPYAFSVAFVQTAINLIAGVIKIIYAKKKLKMKIKYHLYDKQLVNNLLRLSISVFVVSIVDQVFWKSNQFILGIISGTSAVALYSIAAQIYMNYMPISGTIQGIFLPHISKIVTLKRDDKELSHLFIKIGRIQFILLALVLGGFIVFGKEFISMWAGTRYVDAYYISLIILIPFTIDLIQNIGLAIMQAKDVYQDRAKIYFFVAMLNIVLAVVLGLKFGAIGCAIATGFSMFLGNGVIMNIYYAKKLDLDIKSFWINISSFMPTLFVLTIFGFGMTYLLPIDGWLLFIGEIIVFCILYSLAIWKFNLNSYEKDLIVSVLKKIRR